MNSSPPTIFLASSLLNVCSIHRGLGSVLLSTTILTWEVRGKSLSMSIDSMDSILLVYLQRVMIANLWDWVLFLVPILALVVLHVVVLVCHSRRPSPSPSPSAQASMGAADDRHYDNWAMIVLLVLAQIFSIVLVLAKIFQSERIESAIKTNVVTWYW